MCSLNNLNIPNFITNNCDITAIFQNCRKLKRKNVVTKNKAILNKIMYDF